LNVVQEPIHHALRRNIRQRCDADQLDHGADVGKSHPRNPTLAAVPGVNVRWAVIVGKHVNHGPSGFGDEHPAHDRI
jgi:hypothetical protein